MTLTLFCPNLTIPHGQTPFPSYDESMAPENMNDNNRSERTSGTHPTPSNIVPPSGSSDSTPVRTDATPVRTDTTPEEVTYIPWVDEEVLGIFDQPEENSQEQSLSPPSSPPLVQLVSSHRSRRESKIPLKFNDYIIEGKYKYGIEKTVNYSNLNNATKCFISNLNKTIEPQSYSEAANDPNWIKAMNEEMEALYRNNTWEITTLPPNRKPIGCRWIYKIKYKSDGQVERYKARLVAKGYNQREGIDYAETFSPVAKLVTVRIVITQAVNNDWPLFQLDINNAFLYGNLDEDVYMQLPQCYHTKGDTNVCRLKKSL